MSGKHTPGPWRVGREDTGHYVMCGDHFLAESIAREADARLVAAAPDLLAACETAEEFLYGEGEQDAMAVRLTLVAAIEKARGQG